MSSRSKVQGLVLLVSFYPTSFVWKVSGQCNIPRVPFDLLPSLQSLRLPRLPISPVPAAHYPPALSPSVLLKKFGIVIRAAVLSGYINSVLYD